MEGTDTGGKDQEKQEYQERKKKEGRKDGEDMEKVEKNSWANNPEDVGCQWK